MNQVTGILETVTTGPSGPSGTVNVKGVRIHVPLLCVPDARVGDTVLVDAGVAVSVIEQNPAEAGRG